MGQVPKGANTDISGYIDSVEYHLVPESKRAKRNVGGLKTGTHHSIAKTDYRPRSWEEVHRVDEE